MKGMLLLNDLITEFYIAYTSTPTQREQYSGHKAKEIIF